MVSAMLNVVLWIVLVGLATFCILYAFWNKPWQDPMGRHVLAFMSGLALAFFYAVISRYVPEPWRDIGWLVVVTIIALVVWWRDTILIIYHIQERRR